MRPTNVVFVAQYATEPGDRHKPSSNEIIDMHKRAVEVVRLMDQLRRMDNGQEPMPQDEQTRAPKRPWEDVDGESESPQAPAPNYDVRSVIFRIPSASSSGLL